MDLVYTVSRRLTPKSQSNLEWTHEGHATCSISTRNIVAFASTTQLEDSSGKTWGSHVYVADLNLPWDPHLVLSHDEEITCLEWDVSGSKLLIADIIGHIQIWSMKEYIMNDWICNSTATFFGEHILCAVWFHHGKKIVMNSERKDSFLYSEKFIDHVRFSPSIRHFGGRPRDGCLAITMSGMVCVVIIQSDGTTITSCESLGSVRSRLKVVHLCYGKNGDFLVTASDGTAHSAVQCYKITLRLQLDKCAISSQAFPSFYPNCYGSNVVTDKTVNRITHLKFVVREAADAIVVCAAGTNESVVELWELREKPITLHKMFPNPSMDAKFKTVSWQHQASFKESSQVVALTTPRTSIYDGSPPPSYILAAYKDSAIKCFYRESLQLVCSITINPNLHYRDDNGLKQTGGAATISDMQLTWTGSALVAIDCLSQLYLYRLLPVTDPGGPVSANYAVSLLEYCLITGLDWWDILLGLRPGMIESICDKMTDIFNRQPPSFQQYRFSRFLAIKMSLYRCLSTGQNKVGDCYALLMLNAVANCFKSLLRPTELTSQDRGPSENLSAIMTSKLNSETIDVDKVLLNFEKNKEFCVEPATLQSLQQLIQFVADLTLYILASLPQQYQNSMRYPGAGLLADVKALSTLRELIVILRLWGLIRSTCLPTFTKTSESLDVLSLLFKLLTKTLLCHGGEPDDGLLDECCLLTSQVLVPDLHLAIGAQGVASPAFPLNSLPLPFEYGVSPSFMKYRPEPNIIDGAIPSYQKYDIVRHLYMGIDPPAYKQCTRCASVSIVKIPPKSPATKAWDQRWARSCPCGGHWKLVKCRD